MDQEHSPNVIGYNDCTILHMACGCGHIEIVKFLLQNSADVTATNRYINTPIHVAVKNNQYNIVKYFIEEINIDPNMTGKYENTLLHSASDMGLLDIVKYLIETCHCDPMATNSYSHTPLHQAAMSGKLEVVKYFIENLNLSPNVRGQNGETLLHMASAGGHLDVIQYLIEFQHCNPMITDNFNQMPLDLAEQHDHSHVVSYLLENLEYFMTMEKSLSDTQSSSGILKDTFPNTEMEATRDTSSSQLPKPRSRYKERDASDILYNVSTSIECSSDNINPLYEKTSSTVEGTQKPDNVRTPKI